MRRELQPNWSDDDQKAGKRAWEAWDQFFSAEQKTKPASQNPFFQSAEAPRISQILADHETELLRYPNVVGVSEGIRTKAGQPTGEPVLVVYVDRKIPENQLAPDAVLPKQVDGIPVDVVEIGSVEALPQ